MHFGMHILYQVEVDMVVIHTIQLAILVELAGKVVYLFTASIHPHVHIARCAPVGLRIVSCHSSPFQYLAGEAVFTEIHHNSLPRLSHPLRLSLHHLRQTNPLKQQHFGRLLLLGQPFDSPQQHTHDGLVLGNGQRLVPIIGAVLSP